MKLLLINPKFTESFWSFSWALDNVTRDKKALNSPLGLATLAALTPPAWEITIIDENVEPIDWSFEADIVGVCGMGVQVTRQKEILSHFRKKGHYVVAGGSYASLCPEEYSESANTVIAGEAERIWPEFCKDFQAGRHKKLYRETGEVDLSLSPVPRYDLLRLDLYQKVSLQFSRGCPYRCEFCDIIIMFGRKPRTKSVEQVERELDLLRERGVTSVFFVDDNLIGHIPKAKELLKYLIDYQKRHDYRFTFGTEASLNMAADPELMRLFHEANFEWVFIGIETPNKESLKETKKTQNLRGDPLTAIRTIYSYGIEILAGFIVGFDADDRAIFDQQHDFIVTSGITVSMVGLLMAIPKTPLYDRLKKAGRLLNAAVTQDNTRSSTNIIPLKMTHHELIAGYEDLHRRLTEDRTIYRRIANKIRYLKNPLRVADLSWGQKIAYFLRLMGRGILPGGVGRIYWFVRSFLLGFRYPQKLSTVVTDWIAALSLRDYRDRHFGPNTSKAERIIQLKDFLDRQRVRGLSRSLRRTLKKSHEKVVIDCRQLRESSSLQIQILLKKLKGYRHQIRIQLPESLYQSLQEHLTVFQYTLVSV